MLVGLPAVIQDELQKCIYSLEKLKHWHFNIETSAVINSILFPAEVKAGLLAMESPSNGDVEGMKNPGLELDKGSDGLIHRQDYLEFCVFSFC